jgi:hypothetical protein
MKYVFWDILKYQPCQYRMARRIPADGVETPDGPLPPLPQGFVALAGSRSIQENPRSFLIVS